LHLCTFLGIECYDINIVTPSFNLPLSIDSYTVLLYTKKNNPYLVEKNIERLEAEKNLYSVKLNNSLNGNISLNFGSNQYAETFAKAYQSGNVMQVASIGLQIPVFQWGTNKNNIRIAENTFQIKQLMIEKSIKEFENDINEKINTYNHSVNLWFTAKKFFTLSKERYQMLVLKFSMGKVSVYELTNAQQEQNTAMQRYYDAIKEAYESYFALRHLTLFDFKTGKELEDIFVQ
jgi:outer membrane protein TolC